MIAASDWIRVTAERARRHPLFGVKGWLVVMAIGLVLASLHRAVVTAQLIADIAIHGAPLQGSLIDGLEMVGSAVMAIAYIGVFFLMLLRAPFFPKSVIATALAGILLPIFYLMLLRLGVSMDTDTARATLGHGHVSWAIAVNAVLGVTAMIYVLSSRRVNVTFLQRVHASEIDFNDPFPKGREPQTEAEQTPPPMAAFQFDYRQVR